MDWVNLQSHGCYTPPCTSDAFCNFVDAGTKCDLGKTGLCYNNPCRADDDCKVLGTGDWCERGVCVYNPCRTDGDCIFGQNHCITPVSGNNICVNNPCQVADDCKPLSNDPMTCKEGSCIKITCNTVEDCFIIGYNTCGMDVNHGVKVCYNSPCESDVDCEHTGTETTCSNGKCVSVDCWHDDECH